MARELNATVALREGMAFTVASGSGHEIVIDTSTEGGGQNQGPSPMELLLMGTAGCTAIDVIGILRKKRQQVMAYQVRIYGARAEIHPKVFTDITIEHIVTGHAVDEAAVVHAIELSNTKYCSAHAMMSKTAHITTIHRIIEASTGKEQ